MDSIENKIAARLVLQLRQENEWLTSVNDRLHQGLRDYGKLVDELRQEIARLSASPQWERERDCYDVNAEYVREQP